MRDFTPEEVAAILAEAGDPEALLGSALGALGVDVPERIAGDSDAPPPTDEERAFALGVLQRLAPEGAGSILTGVFGLPEGWVPTVMGYLQGAFDPIVVELREPANRQMVGERVISVLAELGSAWGWDPDLVAHAVTEAWPRLPEDEPDGDPESV